METKALFFDPNSSKFINDPYPIYAQLRRKDPIHKMQNGCWVFTQYEDVSASLKDKDFSNKPHPFSTIGPHNKERYPAARVACNLMAFSDSHEHERLRKPFVKNFRTQLQHSKQEVSQITHELFDTVKKETPIDFLNDIANPLAARAICRFIGFPENYISKLTEWSRHFFYLFHAIPNATIFKEVNESILEFESITREIYQRKRFNVADDLMSLMHSCDGLTEDEIIHNIMLIAADGIGNVDVGIAIALRTLLSFPEELDRLRLAPELTKLAISECLRYDSPAQYQGRILLKKKEVRGTTIPAMSIVLLALASANRDENQAADAEDFRIDRTGFRHVSFGLGSHSCMGSALVLQQFEEVVTTILTQNIDISLVPQPIRWHARAGHRWPETLPVQIK